MIQCTRWVVSTAGILSLLTATQVHALSFVGGPFDGNSWSVRFSQSQNESWNSMLVGQYDYVRLDWVSGATLEPPGLRNYTTGGGNTLSEPAYGHTSTFSWATGQASTSLQFDMVFDDPRQATVVEYRVYNGTQLRQAQRISFNSSGGFSGASDIYTDTGRYTPVPEPSTAGILLGIGVLGLAGRRISSRRRRV